MSPDEVRQAMLGFSRDYVMDWKHWQRTYNHQMGQTPSHYVVAEFGRILRKWQAARPRPMRRPQNEARHAAPYLDDLVTAAWPHLQTIVNVSVRQMGSVTPDQIDALEQLWDVFRNLTAEGHATCVGITKSVLLLTEGRIGPAFDSSVRQKLDISSRPNDSSTWIYHLCDVGHDIITFETRHGVSIETLLPVEWAPINVGRVYDMIAGPR